MRDYSFLLSDDADLPDAKEEIRPRSSAPKANSQSVQRLPPVQSKLPMDKSANSASISNGLRKTDPSKQIMQRKTGLTREAPVNRPNPAPAKPDSAESKIGTVRNASGKSVGNNLMQRKVTMQVVSSNSLAQVVGSNRPPRKVANDPRLKKGISTVKQQLPSQKHHPEQRKPTQGTDQVGKILKQSMPPPRPQHAKQNLSRGNYDKRPKKRPAPRSLSNDEEVDYGSLIRGMFRYNPDRYAGDDEDDSDMEVGFDMIQKEEQRSSKIAKKEDEEQLHLIEEEEKRERQRKMKKKLKHG